MLGGFNLFNVRQGPTFVEVGVLTLHHGIVFHRRDFATGRAWTRESDLAARCADNMPVAVWRAVIRFHGTALLLPDTPDRANEDLRWPVGAFGSANVAEDRCREHGPPARKAWDSG